MYPELSREASGSSPSVTGRSPRHQEQCCCSNTPDAMIRDWLKEESQDIKDAVKETETLTRGLSHQGYGGFESKCERGHSCQYLSHFILLPDHRQLL